MVACSVCPWGAFRLSILCDTIRLAVLYGGFFSLLPLVFRSLSALRSFSVDDCFEFPEDAAYRSDTVPAGSWLSNAPAPLPLRTLPSGFFTSLLLILELSISVSGLLSCAFPYLQFT